MQKSMASSGTGVRSASPVTTHTLRRGSTMALAIGAVATITVASVYVLMPSAPATTAGPVSTTLVSAASASVPTAPTSSRVRAELFALGLDVQTLTAAGLTSEQVTGVITTARTSLSELADTIDQAREQLERHASDEARLTRRIQSGQATSEDSALLQTARSGVITSRSQLDSARSLLMQDLTANLPDATRTRLASLCASRDQELPVHLRCSTRSVEEAARLREALGAVRAAEYQEIEVPAEAAAIVAAAEADGAASAAASNLTERLIENKAAWASALADR